MSILYRALLFIGHSSWSWLEYISAGTSASSTGGLSTNSSVRGTQGSAVGHDARSGYPGYSSRISYCGLC